MPTESLPPILTVINTILLCLLSIACSAGVIEYFRLKGRITHLQKLVRRLLPVLHQNMDCDSLIDQLLSDDDVPTTTNPQEQKPSAHPGSPEAAGTTIDQNRARLAAIIAGGKAKEFIGKQVTLIQLDEMADEDVMKLYGRYEARLGATMTKTLGSSALKMYAMAASAILPIPPKNQPKLIADLEEDPFVDHALTSACCELYHRYGIYLAPLTAALTTAKHCQFGGESRDSIAADQQMTDGPCNRQNGTSNRSGESDFTDSGYFSGTDLEPEN